MDLLIADQDINLLMVLDPVVADLLREVLRLVKNRCPTLNGIDLVKHARTVNE